jgi:hypothetical protein
MLVALGDAAIGVTQVVPTGDEDGMYHLTVNTSSIRATGVLAGIGCVVMRDQDGAYSYSDRVRREDGSPLSDYL